MIDDEISLLKLFSSSLKQEGYVVFTASSGNEGLRLFKENQFDLVLLDLKMPGLNGVEVLREIRKIDNAVPVYITTANEEKYYAELENCKKKGLNFELLIKPVGIDSMTEMVAGIMGTPRELLQNATLSAFKFFGVTNNETTRALIENLESFLGERLKNNYSLDVIDVLERSDLAVEFDVLATPTLIRTLPRPCKRIVGNLKDLDAVAGILGIL